MLSYNDYNSYGEKMIKLIGIFLLLLGGCAFHSSLDSSSVSAISFNKRARPYAYSKEINYWVDGEMKGRGKNKQWVGGHWEVKMAIPDEDPGYRWKNDKWKRD